MTKIHATSVALPAGNEWAGILLLGPSGSGKSDFALRLIMEAGAKLISDDQTVINQRQTEPVTLTATAPKSILGKIEVRGLGIVPISYIPKAPILLAVELVSSKQIERLPPSQGYLLEGVNLPMLKLNPFEASSISKLKLATQLIVSV